MSDAVLVERRGRALIITINRPGGARNAMNLAVAQGVADAVDELDNSPELSVAVITRCQRKLQRRNGSQSLQGGVPCTSSAAAWGFTEAAGQPIIAAVEAMPWQAAPNWCWPAI